MKVFTNVDFQNVFGFLPTPTGPANSSFCSAGIFNIFSGAFLAFTVMLAKKNMEQKTISIM